MISERTLKRWRRDSLRTNAILFPHEEATDMNGRLIKVLALYEERILLLTQELMDLYLIQKWR